MLEPLFDRDPLVVEHPDCEGPPLTDEMVASAELTLGVKLPQAYVDLIRGCNGGYTNDAAFPTTRATGWAPDHVPVDVIFGIPGPDNRGRFDTGAGILVTAYMTEEWGLPSGLVLLNGDGHWWIALDYRLYGATGPPTVVWIDVERDEDVQLAPSFEDFIAGLVTADEFRVDEE